MNTENSRPGDRQPIERPDIGDLKHHYHLNGWAKIPQLLGPDEVARGKAIIDEAITREEFKPKASGAQADQASNEYQHVMRVYRALSRFYPEIEAITRRIGSLVGQIHGWERTRLWQDRVFIKPGREFGSRPTVWHQDIKVPVDRRGWATVWIAMMDIPKTRGPMTFLNGSHRLGHLGFIEQLKTNYDLSELLNEHDWEFIKGFGTGAPLAAGDATLHNINTLHRAGVNKDAEDRVVLAISYMDADQLYSGAPNPVTAGLGLRPNQPFDHPHFPIVA